jgi:hypothetical protein
MVFGLNRSGIEHTIYRTRGELANHCTKDAVDLKGEGTQSNTENNTGTRDQYVSETKSPRYRGTVLLQLCKSDIG